MRADLFGLRCFYRKELVQVRPAIPILPDGLREKAAGLASASVPTFSQNLQVAPWLACCILHNISNEHNSAINETWQQAANDLGEQ